MTFVAHEVPQSVGSSTVGVCSFVSAARNEKIHPLQTEDGITSVVRVKTFASSAPAYLI